MHRFFVTDIDEAHARLLPAEAQHARRVLRLGVGDEVSVTDGAGLSFLAAICSLDDGAPTVKLIRALDSGESPARITLYQGIPKADKLELIAQKATELGVFRIVPVRMTRSVAKLGSKDADKKRERLHRIALEAVKQCGRSAVPKVLPAMDFDEAVRDMAARSLVVMPWEEAKSGRMADAHKAHPHARDIGLVIGPEGGIEQTEARAIKAMGGISVTLGPRILRCETAAISALAMAQQLWGDV